MTQIVTVQEVRRADPNAPAPERVFYLMPTSQGVPLTEEQFVQRSLDARLRNYRRGVEIETEKLAKLGPNAVKARIPLESNIKFWGEEVARIERNDPSVEKLRDGYRASYIATVKKAISKGEPVPLDIVKTRPEFTKAVDARARYEKGLHTSFANRSAAIHEETKSEWGIKVKRQDGKTITPEQIEEITGGVRDTAQGIGHPVDHLLRGIDVTIAHTNGKHPFLKSAGGLYSGVERTVSMGTADVLGRPIRATAHELAHALDIEAGNELGYKTRTYKGSRSSSASRPVESTSLAEHDARYWNNDKQGPDGRLLMTATGSMTDYYKIQRLVGLKGDALHRLDPEQQVEIERIQVHLGSYWKEPREVFARLVEQYVATKLGKESLAAHSPEYYERAPGYWSKEKFVEMAPAVEKALAARIEVLETKHGKPSRSSPHEAGPSPSTPTIPAAPAPAGVGEPPATISSIDIPAGPSAKARRWADSIQTMQELVDKKEQKTEEQQRQERRLALRSNWMNETAARLARLPADDRAWAARTLMYENLKNTVDAFTFASYITSGSIPTEAEYRKNVERLAELEGRIAIDGPAKPASSMPALAVRPAVVVDNAPPGGWRFEDRISVPEKEILEHYQLTPAQLADLRSRDPFMVVSIKNGPEYDPRKVKKVIEDRQLDIKRLHEQAMQARAQSASPAIPSPAPSTSSPAPTTSRPDPMVPSNLPPTQPGDVILRSAVLENQGEIRFVLRGDRYVIQRRYPDTPDFIDFDVRNKDRADAESRYERSMKMQMDPRKGSRYIDTPQPLPKYEDGRTKPLPGDEVYYETMGFGGSTQIIHGVVKMGPKGLMVTPTATSSLIGGKTPVEKRRSHPLSLDWTKQGEESPMSRRMRESLERQVQQRAESERINADRERFAVERTQASISRGEEPVLEARPELVGRVARLHWHDTDQLGVITDAENYRGGPRIGIFTAEDLKQAQLEDVPAEQTEARKQLGDMLERGEIPPAALIAAAKLSGGGMQHARHVTIPAPKPQAPSSSPAPAHSASGAQVSLFAEEDDDMPRRKKKDSAPPPRIDIVRPMAGAYTVPIVASASQVAQGGSYIPISPVPLVGAAFTQSIVNSTIAAGEESERRAEPAPRRYKRPIEKRRAPMSRIARPRARRSNKLKKS